MIDPVNSKMNQVEDYRPEVREAQATTQAQQAAATQSVEKAPEPSVQAQASEALPEIDQARTANRKLAHTWTSMCAAHDGSIRREPEPDWSAWERAERGLPAPEPAAGDPPPLSAEAGGPGNRPRLSPRDWTPEGYQPSAPDTLRTADLQIHQVAPGVFVDDNWNRTEAPHSSMLDLEGNPIAVAPPTLTGLPQDWTVDPNNGAILDDQGQAVASPLPTPAASIKMLPALSSEEIQRLTGESMQRLKTEGKIPNPDGSGLKEMQTVKLQPPSVAPPASEEVSNTLPPNPETVSIYDPQTGELLGTRPFRPEQETLSVGLEPNSEAPAGTPPATDPRLAEGRRVISWVSDDSAVPEGMPRQLYPVYDDSGIPDPREVLPDYDPMAGVKWDPVRGGYYTDPNYVDPNPRPMPQLGVPVGEPAAPVATPPGGDPRIAEGRRVISWVSDDSAVPEGMPRQLYPVYDDSGIPDPREVLPDYDPMAGVKWDPVRGGYYTDPNYVDPNPRPMPRLGVPVGEPAVAQAAPPEHATVQPAPAPVVETPAVAQPQTAATQLDDYEPSMGTKGSARRIAPPPGKVILTESPAVEPAVPAPVAQGGVVSMQAASPPPAAPAAAPAAAAAAAAAPAAPPPFSERDLQLQANPRLAEVQANFQAYQASMPRATMTTQGDGESWTQEIEPSAEEKAAYASRFVDAQSGITAADLQHLEQSTTAENQRIEARRIRAQAAQNFSEATFGLNSRDKQLLANPQINDALARYNTAASRFSSGLESWTAANSAGNSESGGAVYDINAYNDFRENFVSVSTAPGSEGETINVMNLRFQDVGSWTNSFVDSATGLTGAELAHLQRAQTEQQQGEAAQKKLDAVKVGSFTGNKEVESVPANRAFAVIGQDQREALLAKGYSMLGKAYVLNDTGQVIMPDEHETGVYFLSNSTVQQLQGGGVIDTANGGLNIDGLYLDGGNATIGTTRPKGGLFGSVVNAIGHILPGGAVGRVIGDAISDVNQFLNQPAQEFLNAVGDDHGFAAQVLGHQEASVDVLAHAGETGNHTYDELVRRTAEYGQVDQVANAVGQALIATGIGTVVGAAITAASGSMMAGHAQLQGQADADPNQGITQAATAYFLAQAGGAIGGAATSAAGTTTTFVNSAGAVQSVTAASTASAFVGGVANNIVSQAITTGDVDLGDALQAGVLGAVGFNTQIGAGVNAVQVFQAGQALVDGNAAGIASSAVGIAGSVVNSSRQASSQVPSNDPAGRNAEPVASVGGEGDTPAPGPQSAGGPETPEPVAPAASPTVTDPAQAIRRIDNATGDQVVQRPDGSWLTVTPDNRPVRLDQTDASGRTVVTRFGEDGSVSGRRITQPDGVILESQTGSNRVVITAGSQSEAFAAARAQGLGVFEYQGAPFHTLRDDQIAAAEQRLISSNPELANLTAAERRQLVIDATSRDAIRVFNNASLPNVPGLDAATIAAGVNLGQSRQEVDHLAGRFPEPPATPEIPSAAPSSPSGRPPASPAPSTPGTSTPPPVGTESGFISWLSDQASRITSGNSQSLNFLGVFDPAATGLDHPAMHDPSVFVVTGHANNQYIDDQRTLPNIARFWGSLVGQTESSRQIKPEDLVSRVKESGTYQPGMPLVLLGCNLGTGEGLAYAQRVADLLGVPVAAGDGYVASDERGSSVSTQLTPDGKMPKETRDEPHRGLTWFTPKKGG